MDQADVEVAEKYRRIIEAYRIEGEYDQTIVAWSGPIDQARQERTVDFLRIGRVALYNVTLDRSAAARFDPGARAWVALDRRWVDAIDQATRIAHKQAPPNLLDVDGDGPKPPQTLFSMRRVSAAEVNGSCNFLFRSFR
jgi:hypothetical protein